MSLQSRSEAVGTPSRVPESLEARSIPSNPRRRKPDDQTCCDGVVEQSTGVDWLIEGVDGFKRRMCTCSNPPGTEEPCSADTGELWSRVYTGHVEECLANVVRSEAVETSRDQTSGFHWPLGQPRWAHAESCLWWSLATKPARCYSSGYEMQWKHVQGSLRSLCRVTDVFGGSGVANRSTLNIW